LTEFVGLHAVERIVVLGPVVEVIGGSGVQRTGLSPEKFSVYRAFRSYCAPFDTIRKRCRGRYEL